MMIWPWEMSYSIVDLAIRVACAFSSKLPYRPFGAMFVVKEFDEGVSWVAVSALRVCRGRAGCCNDWLDIRTRRCSLE